MKRLAKGLVRGKDLYQWVNPAWPKVLKMTKVKWIFKAFMYIPTIKKYSEAKSLDDVVRMFSCSTIKDAVFGNVKKVIIPTYKRAMVIRRPIIKINGMGGKTWIEDEIDQNKRVVKHMRIVFHQATNPHLDIHIGHLSLVINLGSKPIMNDIKFDKDGGLTAKSRFAILNLLREEVMNNSRMAQSFDHSITNAETSWNIGESGIKGYGAGLTRQVIINEPVEIMSVDNGIGKTIKMYCPILNKHRLLYLHKLFPGDKKKAPIVTWGVIKKMSPSFEDRLYLKTDKDIKTFKKNVDPCTVTKKYDGASAYFDTIEKETTWWSPRVSIVTGDRIQYSGKVPELFRIRHKAHPRGIGELMFKRKFNPLNPAGWFRRNRYLTAAETGGVLNSDKIRPMNIIPDFRMYRIDRWEGKPVFDLAFFENRKLQETFADLSEFINLPELVAIQINKGIEGLVGVPEGKSINEGHKQRFWGEAHDWEVTYVALGWGPKGKPSGAIWFKSLDSGKGFKLGPGQLGKENEFIELLNRGNALIGMVAKVDSRKGHEGRAARLAEWHLDKGAGY